MITASDALQALEIVSALPAAVDLVVSDLRLPRMDGLQLASHLLQPPPMPKLLLIPGFTATAEVTGLPGPFLPKPFSRDELLRAVDRLLSG